ncbi:hypothetical protein PybrP1_007543, partial [[Pythium] brassicae (nom. inval.)]
MTAPILSIDTQHEDMIHDAQLDYYGKRLATCSSDRTVKVYDVTGDVQNNEQLLTGHEGPVWQVAWAHPKFGSLLASCSYDGKVIIYREQSLNQWTQAYVHAFHEASVNSIAWAPHEYGLSLACASADGSVSVVSYTGLAREPLQGQRTRLQRCELGAVQLGRLRERGGRDPPARDRVVRQDDQALEPAGGPHRVDQDGHQRGAGAQRLGARRGLGAVHRHAREPHRELLGGQARVHLVAGRGRRRVEARAAAHVRRPRVARELVGHGQRARGLVRRPQGHALEGDARQEVDTNLVGGRRGDAPGRQGSAAPVKATPQATADTIRKIREQLETLEKRELHIEKKIGLQLEEAKKKSAGKDKRGAIFALKRKKMFEAEIEKLQGARMTLETQVMTLESAHVNMETFQALRSGANQMKAIHGQMNVDTVDNIMDDIQEEMATADEIGRAISQPLGSTLYDDDELEEELRMMEELGLEEEALKEPAYAQPAPAVPAAPAPVPAAARVPVPAAAAPVPLYDLPEVPTHRVESNINVVGHADEDELEALRKLEAAVAATDGVSLEISSDQSDNVQQLPTHDRRIQQEQQQQSRRSSVRVLSARDVLEASEELLFLEVRPPVFAFVWLGMICIHVACGAALALQARLYVYLTSPYMSYYVHLIKPDVVRMYRAVAVIFGLLSAIHWHVVLRLCIYSLQQRKFAFFPANHNAPPKHHAVPDIRSSNPTAWTRFKARMHTLHVVCFSRRGILGVESRFFYVYFYSREFIELSSQIYQAYRASVLVARPWLNNLSVAIIIVNCFSTPIIQYWYKKRPEMRRVYLLAIDAVLDFAVAVVVPVSIFAPYARAFDRETQTFPSEKLADQQWFVNAVLENQEIFVVSTLDLVFKIIPHLSIRGCLKKVRALVRKDTSFTSVTAQGQRVRVLSSSVASASKRSLRFQKNVDRLHERQRRLTEAKAAQEQRTPETDSGSQTEWHRQRVALGRSCSRASRLSSQFMHKYAGKLIRLLFLVIGTAVLLIHGLAFRTSYYGDKSGCWQIMRPWFATKLSCSVYQVDCSRLVGAPGNASQVENALKKLHASSVAALLFTHCPGLEIPPIVREYHHLMLIDVFNSTLVSWPREAAVTHSTNSLLLALSFVRVNFTDGVLPDGVTSEGAPRSLSDFKVSTTNLVDLPPDLHTKWPQMSKVFVENSQLRRVPTTLSHLRVEKLSLEGNVITELPEALFSSDHSYFILALSNNPLLSLPSTADDLAAIRYLHVHGTQLASFPLWVYEKLAAGAIMRVFAHRTPFCEQKTAQEIRESFGADAAIACVFNGHADSLGDSGGMYPLAFMDALLFCGRKIM